MASKLNPTLLQSLANALEIPTEDIMDVRQTAQAGDYGPDPEYTVVLFNFQKFVRVKPKKEEDAVVPVSWRELLNYPQRGTRAQLRELCKLLEIEPEGKKVKNAYIRAIEQYKEEKARLEAELLNDDD